MDSKQEINEEVRQMARQELKRRALEELTRRFSEEQDQPSSEESFGSKLPRNITAGLAKLGHRTLNAPHDIVQSLEQHLESMGQGFQRGIGSPEIPSPHYRSLSSYIPRQQEYDFPAMLGQKGKGTLTDRAIQGTVEHLPELLGAYGLARAGLRAAPSLSTRRGGKLLSQAEAAGGDLQVSLAPELEIEARKFLPRSRATDEMLARALQGEYAPTFSTQSQIGHHARALQKSPLAAERLQAPSAHELKQLIAQQMVGQLETQGAPEAAELLGKGLKEYARTKELQERLIPLLKRLGLPASVGGAAYAVGKSATHGYRD